MQQTKCSLLSNIRRRYWRHWWLGCLLAFLSVNTRYTTETCATTDRPKSEKTIAAFSSLRLHDGLLTAQVTTTPLSQVLSEMSRLSGARIVWLGQPDTRQVSVTFTALPVTEAIERVLGANNFLLVYTSTDEKARLKEIWITTRYSSTPTVIHPVSASAPMPGETIPNEGDTELTQASTPTPEEPTANESEAELAKMLESQLDTALQGTDRDRRIEAIGFLGGLIEQDPRIRPLLQQLSTSEHDPQVRTAAAEVLSAVEE
jgi:hypothetical protein